MLETKKIGNKIAEARKKVNISQAQLAERLFISPQAVGKWERGESMPDITTFNRLAETLGVDFNYFSDNFPSSENEMTSKKSLETQSSELPTGKQKLSWDMSGGNWVDADFSGLKNLHEKFSSSNLQRCLFSGSEMSGLLLKNNHVDSCDFSGSDISSSHIQNSHLVNSKFKACLLNNTEISESSLKGCDFTKADCTELKIKSCSLIKNTLVNTQWKHTSFLATGFEDVVFEGMIEDCSFENCGFKKVKFQNATLVNTFFKNNKNLKQVQFIDCKVDKITFAFLQNGKAKLTGVTLLIE